jgi:Uma2 family endonuclease
MIGLAANPPSRRPKAERLWSYEELIAEFPESNQPMELWNGKIVMPPSPDASHQESSFDFATALRTFVTQHDLGRVYMAPLDMVLAPRQATQPDVLFVAKHRLNIVKKVLHGAADLAVEVVSEFSHERDRIKKRDLYEQHGVKEYWLLDSDAGTVEVLFLVKGQYTLIGRWRSGETAESRLLPGFQISVSEVLKRPL